MRLAWALGLALAAIAIIASYWRWTTRKAGVPLEIPFDARMALAAAGAIGMAKQYGVTLDYSAESIVEVERILASKHGQNQKQSPSQEELSSASIAWGAYVGETAKRLRGGHWERDSLQNGPNAMPVVLADGTEIFPCAWVYKRLTNGAEDNVQYKFQVMMNQQGK